jgi:hypothetical protein
VPAEILNARTMFFSDMQNPAKAKLILIRGEGMDGLSFHLKAEQPYRRTDSGAPTTPISPKRANLLSRWAIGGAAKDRSMASVAVRHGRAYRGRSISRREQLFHLDVTRARRTARTRRHGHFYSSPKPAHSHR